MYFNLNEEEYSSIPEDAWNKLGQHVYILRDPRDGKVFYVGKGGGLIDKTGNNRVCQHFTEAAFSTVQNSKINRIRDIWQSGERVDWFIIRHNLTNTNEALEIEAALIDAFEVSQNGTTYNLQRGHNSADRGLLSPDDVLKYGATKVSPCKPFSRVFIFPISSARSRGIQPYPATKEAWAMGGQYCNKQEGDLAVGINCGVSEGVFEIEKFYKVQNSKKYGFTAVNEASIVDHELYNKNFYTIIDNARSYWGRGNYLVVQFDGNGKCKILRGSPNSDWFDI